MSEPFIGEIRMFGGNFAPRSWAKCDGQLLSVSQNDALFSLLGTIYGGDGRTTFGLPDMRGRLPTQQGSGPGLTTRNLGSKFGSETVALTTNQLPSHTHTLRATTDAADTNVPSGSTLATGPVSLYTSASTTPVAMASSSAGNTGSSIAHSNIMPFQVVTFIICLIGLYPSRH